MKEHTRKQPRAMAGQWIIFTDLDGTLLDHEDYGWHDARRALEFLSRNAIPVVFSTSKTYAEVLTLQREMGLCHPFIFENGCGVAIPEGYFTPGFKSSGNYQTRHFGPPLSQLHTALQRIRNQHAYRYQCLSMMPSQHLSQLTGLDSIHAPLAQQRLYSEPLYWQDTSEQLDKFMRLLEREGLSLQQGGRFLTLSGDCNKGRSMQWLMGQFQQHHQHPLHSLALGDSGNDLSMLQAADEAVLIHNPHIDQQGALGTFQRSHQAGPSGWNEVVLHFFEHLIED